MAEPTMREAQCRNQASSPRAPDRHSSAKQSQHGALGLTDTVMNPTERVTHTPPRPSVRPSVCPSVCKQAPPECRATHTPIQRDEQRTAQEMTAGRVSTHPEGGFPTAAVGPLPAADGGGFHRGRRTAVGRTSTALRMRTGARTCVRRRYRDTPARGVGIYVCVLVRGNRRAPQAAFTPQNPAIDAACGPAGCLRDARDRAIAASSLAMCSQEGQEGGGATYPVQRNKRGTRSQLIGPGTKQRERDLIRRYGNRRQRAPVVFLELHPAGMR
ncbi:hypothetical protein SKAU_G00317580 [Synaphobranchus kaupii]|uniref:Uncharacterized protein n=1 Tax=Synaphobranchus kaupii TaxID=118154 RepID=A0A9Q1ET48_SYNKA|nr:hypothetical protein SKAU_G00317580 [Synaphobranchus kaupii]